MSNKSKRIAIIVPRLSRYGGMESFAYRLAERLAQENYQVDFICSRVEQEAPQGVAVICLGRWGVFKFLKILHFAFWANKTLKQNNYDLSIGIEKSIKQDILRIGGGPQTNFNAKSIKGYPLGLRKTCKRFMRFISPANLITNLIEAAQIKNTKLIVAVSDLVKEWILNAHPSLNPDKIKVIYNKPDLSKFYPINPDQTELLAQREQSRTFWQLPKDALAIGLAGTNFALKGVAPLIKALALLPSNYHVVIAGGRGHKPYLKLAETLGLKGRVHFIGKVEDMPTFYRALDLFVLPTFYDACSNVILEALACGIKSITSVENGAKHFLPKDQIIQNPADHQELASLIIKTMGKQEAPNFAWSDDDLAGLDAYLDLIKTQLC